MLSSVFIVNLSCGTMLVTKASTGLWETVQEGDSLKACTSVIKSGGLVGPDGAKLHFKWHPTQPGDGKRQAKFQCASHEGCPVVCRAVMIGGKYFVQVSGDDHSDIPVDRCRLSSSMSSGQLDTVRTLVNTGARPAAIVTSLTLTEQEKCKEAGIQPDKRPDRGLVGKVLIWHFSMPIKCDICLIHMEYTKIHIQYTYNTHIIHT